jgi:hypothetical protein
VFLRSQSGGLGPLGCDLVSVRWVGRGGVSCNTGEDVVGLAMMRGEAGDDGNVLSPSCDGIETAETYLSLCARECGGVRVSADPQSRCCS